MSAASVLRSIADQMFTVVPRPLPIRGAGGALRVFADVLASRDEKSVIIIITIIVSCPGAVFSITCTLQYIRIFCVGRIKPQTGTFGGGSEVYLGYALRR